MQEVARAFGSVHAKVVQSTPANSAVSRMLQRRHCHFYGYKQLDFRLVGFSCMMKRC